MSIMIISILLLAPRCFPHITMMTIAVSSTQQKQQTDKLVWTAGRRPAGASGNARDAKRPHSGRVGRWRALLTESSQGFFAVHS